MSGTNPKQQFQFKKFKLSQERCAMKIGTDGVLLGAWTSLNNQPSSILDIGAGTGLIALMLAQRSIATLIDAVEIDSDAYEQCVENFENSPWNDRLFCYHAAFNEFVTETEDSYDLIVCNPPYFEEVHNLGNASRKKARQARYLPLSSLLHGVSSLLAPRGEFALILPFDKENSFIEKAKSYGLFLQRITRVRGNKNAPIKRSLIHLSKKKVGIIERDLVLETSRKQYTQEYCMLTKDFYLKM